MKKILIAVALFFLLAISMGILGYNYVFGVNTTNTSPTTLHIPSASSYKDVVNLLVERKLLKNIGSFDKVASIMKYDRSTIPSGKYTIKPGMNNKELVSLLRSGNQTPVNITLSHGRLLQDIAGALSKNIELDSSTIYTYFSSDSIRNTLVSNGISVLPLFIPNTYQVYWDISASELGKRLKKENQKFWTSKERIEKAKVLDMSPYEVYTLASIVQSESTYVPEQPTIAGLYLNRINRGIPLQADPTVVYATGDFGLRRVLNKHLEIDSPYNTYKHQGLPPGPICMPAISAIDAVLNYEKHNYIYMCAKPGYNSQHSFARTLAQHNNNADIYRRWLNKEGIR